jgi:4-hydroxy-4-methyl-2-oxoglutarate aldolase
VQDVDLLFTRLGKLHTALVSDVLDALGHRTGAMDFLVHALGRTRQVIGRAFTLDSVPIEEPEPIPYGQLLAAYPHMAPGDVVVLATNGELGSGVWGELLSTAARARGATGAVTDGLTRDLDQIDAMGFSVFARGTSPTDSAGRQAVQSFAEPVVCGGVEVHPRDVVFGDTGGVVVIPAALVDDAVRLAEEKHRGEDRVRAELERGDDPAEVFARYGIL